MQSSVVLWSPIATRKLVVKNLLITLNLPKGRYMPKFQYIDLFTGCGGLSLGLYLSRYWQGLFAIEKDENAFKTLSFNLIQQRSHFDWVSWLPQTSHDIDEVLTKYEANLKSLTGRVHLVAGGPPCQGFSFAGRRKRNDLRNQMMHSYLRLVELVRPKIIFFENVEGFNVGFKKNINQKTHSHIERGEAYSVILLRKLKKLGYTDATFKIINFSDFGVPQERERFIIVATTFGKASQFFEKLEKRRLLFLQSKGLPLKKITIQDAISDLLRKHGTIPSPDSLGFDAGVYGTTKLSPYQRLMKSGCSLPQPDSHRFARHRPSTVEKFTKIIEKNMTPREIREGFASNKANTSLLRGNKPSPTLTTLPDDHIHYEEPRILTVREYARIQSFPDYYEIKGKYTTGGNRRTKEVPRYSQIGNAIPPLFGEFCGILLGELLDESNATTLTI